MSNEAITWAYQQDVSSGAKFVLVALADMADEDHSCFPGQAKLAKMTGQGERTVRRQLLELEQAGFIGRRRRFDSAGHRTSDRYTLPVGQIPTGQNDQWPILPVAIDDSPTGQVGQVSLREPNTSPQPPDRCSAHLRRHRKDCPNCVAALAASKAKPPWCGRCDERTRLRERPDSLAERCPECHPLTQTAATEASA